MARSGCRLEQHRHFGGGRGPLHLLPTNRPYLVYLNPFVCAMQYQVPVDVLCANAADDAKLSAVKANVKRVQAIIRECEGASK